jgi:hypothetical protein
MNFRDSSQATSEKKYISKKVLINGQFVTLYSVNGQTWLSSPEDIPALMERLENARVTLNTAEKVAEAEDAKVPAASAESKDKKEKKPEAEQPERVLSTKYRMKGPKPRPILRQDGVVIKGTPIEPISASSTVMGFSSDLSKDAKNDGAKSVQSAKSSRDKAPKIIAPVASKKPVKSSVKAAAGRASAKLKKNTAKDVKLAAEDTVQSKAQSKAQPKAQPKAQSKRQPVRLAKEKSKTAVPVKQQRAKKVPERKVAAKSAAKKTGNAASKTKTNAAKTPQKAGSKAKKSKR